MEKKAIGFKVEWKAYIFVLMFVAGLAFMAGGILFFVFIMQGAIGGALAGALVGCGAGFFVFAITAIRLPKEVVFTDGKSVYFVKKTIDIRDIQDVSYKKNVLTLLVGGKRIAQGLLKNSAECAEYIKNLQNNQSR